MMGIARTSISGMRVWGRARWGFSGRPVSDFPPTADAGRGYALREVPPSKERVMIPEGRQSFDLMSPTQARIRSEEHTSELQSQSNLVCRLLLEKKKKTRSRAEFFERRRGQ